MEDIRSEMMVESPRGYRLKSRTQINLEEVKRFLFPPKKGNKEMKVINGTENFL